MGDIDLILNFAAGLKHQAQFRDQRLLNALEREGGGSCDLRRHVWRRRGG